MAQWAAAGSATSPSTAALAAIFVRVTAIMFGSMSMAMTCRTNGQAVQ